MNGYSVEEAAEVLGIPQGRVWELIARGVLAGASEGGASMRVYLRGTTTATVSGTPQGEDRSNGNGHNGNGNGNGHELSPFRELLTEFRNLTERYGQALLALGEARGEVASLRGRVELLEARMDMRLPVRTRPSAAWEMPDLPQQRAPQQASQPQASQPQAPAPQPEEPEAAPAWAEASTTAVPEPEAPVEATAAEAPGAIFPAGETELDASEMDATDAGETDAVADIQAAFEPEPDALEAERAPQPETDQGAHAAEPEPAPAVDAVLPASEGRRGRGDSRAAIAGLAAALARAEDPVLSTLPGAHEAAQALAALQREMGSDSVAAADAAVADPEAPDEPDETALLVGEAGAEDAEVAALSGSEELSAVAPSIELAEEPVGQPVAADMVDERADEEPMEPEASAELVDELVVEEPIEMHATPEPPEPPVDQEAQSPYTTDVVEPDWFADGDFSWLETPEPEGEAEPETTAHEAEAVAEPEAMAEPEPPAADDAPMRDEDELQAAFEPPPEDQATAVAEPMVADETAAVEDEWSAPMPSTDADEPGEEWPAGGQASHGDEAAPEPMASWAPESDRAPSAPGPDASQRIQDAFVEAEPEYAPQDPTPRTEAIRIEVGPEPDAGDGAPSVAGERSRVAAASGVAGFGLFKGQPEEPPAAEQVARPLPDRNEEALMWFGDEFEAEALEIAAPGWRGEDEPVSEPVAPPALPAHPPLQLSDTEIEQLASQEGWDHEEVQAIRGLLGRPVPRTAPEPEEDEEPEETQTISQHAGDAQWEERAPDSASRAAEPPRSPRGAPAARPPQPSPEWLRGRRGPAANAYRRLRRIFPG